MTLQDTGLFLLPAIPPLVVAVTFTPEQITAFTLALGALLTIIFSGLANLVKVLRESKVAIIEGVKVTTEKLAEVSAVAKVIEGHVNSAASTAAATIDALRHEIEIMHTAAVEHKDIAARLAQSAAAAALVVPAPTVIVPLQPSTTDLPPKDCP